MARKHCLWFSQFANSSISSLFFKRRSSKCKPHFLHLFINSSAVRPGINGSSSRTQLTQFIDLTRLLQRQCSTNFQKLLEGCPHHKLVSVVIQPESPALIFYMLGRRARKTPQTQLSASSLRLGQTPGCSAAQCSLTCAKSTPFVIWYHFSQA